MPMRYLSLFNHSRRVTQSLLEQIVSSSLLSVKFIILYRACDEIKRANEDNKNAQFANIFIY